MAKPKTRFVCQECGTVAVKWQGRCSGCGNWNTYAEEFLSQASVSQERGSPQEPEPLRQITTIADARLLTGIDEFDCVLGGGLVTGSLILIGGPPGIGKSTLLLQIARGLSIQDKVVLYVTGEESSSQVKLRSERLQISSDTIFILPEINLESIIASIEKMRPVLVLIDSIQTLYNPALAGAPGSVTQVRECTAALMRAGKTLGITIIIVGHVTKDGSIAGPRVLEHLVDTVLYFEGEGFQNYRILKSVKNRFGSTNETGIFEMSTKGLKGVKNASSVFIGERCISSPGSVIVPVMEGTRPILLELQALVAVCYCDNLTRKTKGIDVNRVALLIAVLDKKVGLRIAGCDVFINAVGGVDADEPALDLPLLLAMASSLQNIPLDAATVAFGEAGLGGEIRGVNQAVARIMEAERLGFKKCILPASNMTDELPQFNTIKLLGVSHINEALSHAIPGMKIGNSTNGNRQARPGRKNRENRENRENIEEFYE
ncbi:MAG: DNA repair protein RadA [Candidatus Xenobiia bacterium LiM19]